MATAVKKLDLQEGELIEVAGRRYEVVPDREGGLILEPAITPISELYAKRGMKPASAEDFERIAGDLHRRRGLASPDRFGGFTFRQRISCARDVAAQQTTACFDQVRP